MASKLNDFHKILNIVICSFPISEWNKLHFKRSCILLQEAITAVPGFGYRIFNCHSRFRLPVKLACMNIMQSHFRLKTSMFRNCKSVRVWHFVEIQLKRQSILLPASILLCLWQLMKQTFCWYIVFKQLFSLNDYMDF